MEHIRQHDDMRMARCSLKTIRNVWVAVVLLLEVGIFIAASARCHWPDPGVSTPRLRTILSPSSQSTQLSLTRALLFFFIHPLSLPVCSMELISISFRSSGKWQGDSRPHRRRSADSRRQVLPRAQLAPQDPLPDLRRHESAQGVARRPKHASARGHLPRRFDGQWLRRHAHHTVRTICASLPTLSPPPRSSNSSFYLSLTALLLWVIDTRSMPRASTRYSPLLRRFRCTIYRGTTTWAWRMVPTHHPSRGRATERLLARFLNTWYLGDTHFSWSMPLRS